MPLVMAGGVTSAARPLLLSRYVRARRCEMESGGSAMSAGPASTPRPALERPATAGDMLTLYDTVAKLATGIRELTQALVDHTAETARLNASVQRLVDKLDGQP